MHKIRIEVKEGHVAEYTKDEESGFLNSAEIRGMCC